MALAKMLVVSTGRLLSTLKLHTEAARRGCTLKLHAEAARRSSTPKLHAEVARCTPTLYAERWQQAFSVVGEGVPFALDLALDIEFLSELERFRGENRQVF